jgi:hypothetical protein
MQLGLGETADELLDFGHKTSVEERGRDLIHTFILGSK